MKFLVNIIRNSLNKAFHRHNAFTATAFSAEIGSEHANHANGFDSALYCRQKVPNQQESGRSESYYTGAKATTRGLLELGNGYFTVDDSQFIGV